MFFYIYKAIGRYFYNLISQPCPKAELMFSSVTKSGVITCKIEWKILDFWDLTELMSNDQCLTSKHLCDPKFPSTVIELRIYPNCCVYSEDGILD
uniref:Uncharacterized protein n=2 Tax=Meloidogyne TaxID=189290 RepID=A0A6V7X761_MELEN|nr:unnamed protein product [Meloidogyne enterolobii]CAD2195109.1 unnamed protein product [Meloidogyne enterolobii]CAD2205532.1 unnamed protein product [Meloidogyne enterolobii]